MIIIEVEQHSPEWFAARCGKATASRMGDLCAKTKTGYGASRGNYLAEIVCERLTNQPTERYTNDAMRWGTEKEPEARSLYELLTGAAVETVGCVRHPTIIDSLCSPDGLVGSVGMIQIKCPQSKGQIENLLRGEADPQYVKQMQWELACTGREWSDFVSFNPNFPAEMQLVTHRVMRDDRLIAEIEKEVIAFLSEVDATVTKLRSRYAMSEAT